MRLISLYNRLESKINSQVFLQEDKVPLRVLEEMALLKSEIMYLEVGSGWGRFPLTIAEKYSNINIVALEINKKLSDFTISKGIKTMIGSALDMPFEANQFDVVHCSHLIEHFSPDSATMIIDELFRVVKCGGLVIIRSPLMHNRFYQDIDHVRPYPPESIWSYINLEQQQKRSANRGELIHVTYRKRYLTPFLNYANPCLKMVNLFLRYLWLITGFPFKADGYIMIIKKK